jgi:hypothetical protein
LATSTFSLLGHCIASRKETQWSRNAGATACKQRLGAYIEMHDPIDRAFAADQRTQVAQFLHDTVGSTANVEDLKTFLSDAAGIASLMQRLNAEFPDALPYQG